jgi:hypothetical protein
MKNITTALFSVLLVLSLFISCGKNETGPSSAINASSAMVGTLSIQSQGIVGGYDSLNYSGKEYRIGNLSGTGSTQYNAIINKYSNTPSNGYHNITVSFNGSFTTQSVFNASTGQQVQAEVVIFTAIQEGTVSQNGGSTALIKIPSGNCNVQLSIVVSGQSYSVSPNSSQQFNTFMNTIFSQNPHYFEGNNNCAGVFRVNYTGQIQSNSVVIQTISIAP